MSHVDEFVREKIVSYPGMFTNRTEVLHHALCVNGNGCWWAEDGTILFYTDGTERKWSREREMERIEESLNGMFSSFDDDSKAFLRNKMLERLEEESQVVEEADERVHMRGEIERVYPQNSYALLMNVPNKATPDWKAACEEIREVASKAGWNFP